MGIVSRLFGRGLSRDKEQANIQEELHRKYYYFRELLTANNDILEAMARLEGILIGGEEVTVEAIREAVDKLGDRVKHLIDSLDVISEGRYRALYDNLVRIREAIEQELRTVRGVPLTKPCLSLDKITREMADSVGGKTANLGEVRNRVGLPVPHGFACTAFAYRLFVEGSGIQAELDRLWDSIDWEDISGLLDISRKMQDTILNASVPHDVAEAIRMEAHDLYRLMKGKGHVSIRSSAIGEDGRATFAGQYGTFLNIPIEQVLSKYREVVASKFTPRALFYMHTHGFRESDVAMSVGVFQMIRAKAAGVAYTIDPTDPGFDMMLISGTWGLGKPVVDGTATPDTFLVPRRPGHGQVVKNIVPKWTRQVCAEPMGIREEEVPPELREQPCLTDEQIMRLADYLRTLEAHYRCPQDVEWVVDENDRIFILQTRPLRLWASADRNVEEIPVDPAQHPVVLAGGVTVSPGVGSGIVVRAFTDEELAAFPEGAVLVAHQNSPRFVKVMMKAAAIVTEVGSATGHMASLAREYRVPTIANVGNASALRDGAEVTVDASRCRVYVGRVTQLLESSFTRAAPARDAPALAVLERVLAHVSKLNLTDPSRSTFRAKSCRTLHDITRFCHEMAICEMFQLNDYGNLRGSGVCYKLESDVPLRVYVIDLGGGVECKPNTRFIRPEQIRSRPMLALWRGMATPGIRWSGARPIDLKGFLSVWANTIYDPAKGERGLGESSYAIVASEYVNFGSRLGYHFTTLDSICCERAHDNYITFRFKGGAADIQRRVRRTRFVADVLDSYRFQVDQREDLLNAWVRKLPAQEIEELLAMLGRLIGCARQLDVVMDSDKTTDECTAAFLRGDYAFFEFKDPEKEP